MYIYKITNTVNGKVYIGATKRSIHERWNDHNKRRFQWPDRKLYSAMNEYGIDKFKIEVLKEVDSFQDLYDLETMYISMYNSVEDGYNTQSVSPQREDWEEFYLTHKNVMYSDDVRSKISKSLKEYRKDHPFTDEHKKKLSIWQKGVKLPEWRCELCATRKIACYCLDHGVRHDFSSYKDAGIWWYNTYHPFGDTYSQATYQRKIIDCIDKGFCEFRKYSFCVKITKADIEWFRV